MLAVDRLVGAGAGVDQGAEELGVLVGEVAAELHSAVSGGEGERFARVRLVFLWLGAVGVEDVPHPVTGLTQFAGGQVPGELHELLLSGVAIGDRHV
ncbi:hypothetical protein BJY22_006277 [Kribbella shirazensis]|uniref:Uncharacterized protein n=1 Tax=Kribbella shirazensis TaxID=1105143 RepID=A0A7X6A433_9ACTN|nr:hypothetical protein [Kribbella shirazensis]